MNIEARLSLTQGQFELRAEFCAPANGTIGLFGASGCGKTTLLRAIAGLEAAEGHLKVAGSVWQDESQFLPPQRRAVGYAFQEPTLFPHLTVRANLQYGLNRVLGGRPRIAFDHAVELFGLAQLLERKPGRLSGGEAQRVAIARAILTSPQLLLLDEPVSALDRNAKAEILPFLEHLQRELKIPLIYVSHQMDEVARLADHLLLMEAGRVVAAGPTAELFTRLDLPLARGSEAESLIAAKVAGHDETYGLTYLDFPGGRFFVPLTRQPTGCPVRLRILARDVSLTLEHQRDTSILNVFPASVTEISEEDSTHVVVRLEASGIPLLARLTRKSRAALGLDPGSQVYAQVKSAGILV